MRRIFAIILFALLCYCAIASPNVGEGTLTQHKYRYKGIEYDYFLYIPQNLTADAPLIMVFHGYGSRNIPSIGYGFHPVADANGFAVCYPRGPKDYKGKHYWSVGYEFHTKNNNERDDVGFAVALVRHLQRKYNFSKHNVFATGHSNGGAMSYLLAYRAPNTFAAVAPVSGHIMECTYRKYSPKHPVPVMEIHGSDDLLSRWNGDPHNKDKWGADIAIPRAIGVWVAANRCTYEITDTLPQLRNKVIAHRYVNGTNGNQVWLYEVQGGVHKWSDGSINTPAEIWKFFSLYLK